MVSVLISGAGGDAGIGVIRSLQMSELNLDLVATCISPDSPGLWMVNERFLSFPVDSRQYLEHLVQQLRTRKISVFIPTVDSEIELVARNRQWIEEESGSAVLIGNKEAVLACSDKWLTFEMLTDLGVKTPWTCLATDAAATTGARVLKPRFGRGSRGIEFFDESQVIRTNLSDAESWIVQERVGDLESELTCGVLVLGDRMYFQAFVRKLARGSTVFVESLAMTESLKDTLTRIGNRLGDGYWNVQGMLVSNQLWVFEINPRFSGTTWIVTQFFNGPDLWLRHHLNLETPTEHSSTPGRTWVRYLAELEVSGESIRELRSTDVG